MTPKSQLTQDCTVPIAQSELLLARYQKAGASAEFFKVEGATHAFWNGEWFDDTLKRAVEFFRKQLGTNPVAGPAASVLETQPVLLQAAVRFVRKRALD